MVLRVAKIPGLSDMLDQSPSDRFLSNDENRHMVAGAAARTLAQCTIHPIDTVKTRLQISRPNVARLVAWKAAAAQPRVLLRVSGRAVLATRNYAPFGVRDLYRGLGGAFFGTVPVALVYFCVYERVKPLMADRAVPDAVAHIASAAAGAVASAFVRVPTDTLRHRTQAFLHPNSFAAVPQLFKSKGVRGFYAGFRPTLLRDVPEIAMQFATYECLRAVLQRRSGDKLATWQHLLLGGASGAVAASVTMPVDVLKTQLQCGGKEAASLGIAQTLKRTVADKGVSGLFAGMGPRVTQTAAMSAIFFTLFEFWKAQLKPLSQREGDDRVLSQKLYRKKRKHIWKRQFSFR